MSSKHTLYLFSLFDSVWSEIRGSAFLPHIVIRLSFDRCPCPTLSLGAPCMMWAAVVMLRRATSPLRSIAGSAVSSAAGGSTCISVCEALPLMIWPGQSLHHGPSSSSPLVRDNSGSGCSCRRWMELHSFFETSLCLHMTSDSGQSLLLDVPLLHYQPSFSSCLAWCNFVMEGLGWVGQILTAVLAWTSVVGSWLLLEVDGPAYLL